MVGTGGGVVLVPVLLLFFGMEPAVVAGTSLALVALNGIASALLYLRHNLVDRRSGLIFVAAALPGSIAAPFAVARVEADIFRVLFGAMIASLAVYLLYRSSKTGAVSSDISSRIKPTVRSRRILADGRTYEYSFNEGLAALFNVLIGFVSAFFGAGGGFLRTPVLVTMFGFPVRIAAATSLFAMSFYATAGGRRTRVPGTRGVASDLRRGSPRAAGGKPGRRMACQEGQERMGGRHAGQPPARDGGASRLAGTGVSDSSRPFFTVQSTSGSARAGVLHTPHGTVDTPAFMPVATQGSVKALDSADLARIGAGMVLGNTYHLYLRPGVDVIRGFGGLHRFMAWDGPVLTDSGGFQGFSLEHLRELDETGILFRSHLDGSLHRFTPEAVVEHQAGIGADIVMPLDVCEPAGADRDAVEVAVQRTLRWARRSLDARAGTGQALFGIVQGGVFGDLRELSASETVAMDFPGYAIGGLSVGESKSEMYDVTGLTAGCSRRTGPGT